MRSVEKNFQRYVVLMVGATALIFALLMYLAVTIYMFPKFNQTERVAVEHNAQIVNNIAADYVSTLIARIQPLIIWDVAYDFAVAPAENWSFVEDSLSDPALISEDWQLAIVLDEQGGLIYGRVAYPDPDLPDLYTFDDLSPQLDYLWHSGSFLLPEDPDAVVFNYLLLEGKPMLAVSHPIIPHSYDQAPGGRMIAGSYLDQDFLNRISAISDFDIQGESDPAVLAIWNAEAGEIAATVELADAESYLMISVLRDHDDNPVFGLYAFLPRQISQAAAEMMGFYWVIMFSGLALLLGILLYILNHTVMAPLGGIYRAVLSAKESGRRTIVPETGHAMFRTLAREINAMTSSLLAEEAAHLAAEESTKSKSAFLANMSHELRTPMNGVLGTADLMSRTSLDKRQRMYVDTIIKSSKSLLNILNDILDFSKIEAGKMELVEEEFNLEELCSSIALLLAPNAENKGLELLVDYDPTMPRSFIGDPYRIRQILTNLLTNAIKFTSQGQVALNVDLVEQGIRIQVQDSGIGIKPEDQERLFGKFEQASGSTSVKYGGTGLGLAISRELVEKMQGRLWVESEPGYGSTFFIVLALQSLPSGALPDLSGEKILLLSSTTYGCNLADRLSAVGAQVTRCADCFALDIEEEESSSIRNVLYELTDDPALNLECLGHLYAACAYADIVIVYNNKQQEQLVQYEGVIDKTLSRYASLTDLCYILHHNPYEPLEQDDDEAQPQQRNSRALLVEDNEINLMIAEDMLSRFFRQVDKALNGQEAVDKIRAGGCYDVIFMDCQMPVMDGYEATRQIRVYEQEQGLQPVLILAMTANAMRGDAEKSLAAGMNGHLTKPVSLDSIEQALHATLHKADRQSILTDNSE